VNLRRDHYHVVVAGTTRSPRVARRPQHKHPLFLLSVKLLQSGVRVCHRSRMVRLPVVQKTILFTLIVIQQPNLFLEERRRVVRASARRGLSFGNV